MKYFFKIFSSFSSYNADISVIGSFVESLLWDADTRLKTKVTK